MQIKKNTPSRKFYVGRNNTIIAHTSNIILKDNEMVTFINKNKNEYDVVKKEWGFYATPSINGRLKDNNFKTALVINEKKQIFIMIVEKSKIQKFRKYLKSEKNKIINWLDDIYKI